MESRQDRDERKARCIALKHQFEKLGLTFREVAKRIGWHEAHVSRVWNADEPGVAPSEKMLQCMEQVLQQRKRELGKVVEQEHPPLIFVETCNGASAELRDDTRRDMAGKLHSRLFKPVTDKSPGSSLPEHVAAAIFKLEDRGEASSVYVVEVRSANDADMLTAISHELGDLSRNFATRARRLRKHNRPPPKVGF